MTRANCKQRTRAIWRPWPLVALAIACFALHGCKTETSGKDVVIVDPDAAIKAINSKPNVLGIGSSKNVWLDPRNIAAYRKAHIPGAVHLSFADVDEMHEDVLDGVDVIVVYGDDYNDVKAIAMSKRLISLGYKDVRTLNGGLRQWTSQGHETETGDPPATAASSK